MESERSQIEKSRPMQRQGLQGRRKSISRELGGSAPGAWAETMRAGAWHYCGLFARGTQLKVGSVPVRQVAGRRRPARSRPSRPTASGRPSDGSTTAAEWFSQVQESPPREARNLRDIRTEVRESMRSGAAIPRPAAAEPSRARQAGSITSTTLPCACPL